MLWVFLLGVWIGSSPLSTWRWCERTLLSHQLTQPHFSKFGIVHILNQERTGAEVLLTYPLLKQNLAENKLLEGLDWVIRPLLYHHGAGGEWALLPQWRFTHTWRLGNTHKWHSLRIWHEITSHWRCRKMNCHNFDRGSRWITLDGSHNYYPTL